MHYLPKPDQRQNVLILAFSKNEQKLLFLLCVFPACLSRVVFFRRRRHHSQWNIPHPFVRRAVALEFQVGAELGSEAQRILVELPSIADVTRLIRVDSLYLVSRVREHRVAKAGRKYEAGTMTSLISRQSSAFSFLVFDCLVELFFPPDREKLRTI